MLVNDTARKRAAAKDEDPRLPAQSKPEALAAPAPEPDTNGTGGGAEVVRLDRFRKK